MVFNGDADVTTLDLSEQQVWNSRRECHADPEGFAPTTFRSCVADHSAQQALNASELSIGGFLTPQILNCMNGPSAVWVRFGENCYTGGFATDVWNWISTNGGITSEADEPYYAGEPLEGRRAIGLGCIRGPITLTALLHHFSARVHCCVPHPACCRRQLQLTITCPGP